MFLSEYYLLNNYHVTYRITKPNLNKITASHLMVTVKKKMRVIA